jgi:YHS domain-containing protein
MKFSHKFAETVVLVSLVGILGLADAQSDSASTVHNATLSTHHDSVVTVVHKTGAPTKSPKPKAKLVPQKTCPVMGGAIDKSVFVDYKGKRVYFCCSGCPATFKADPEKYLKILADRGEMPINIPK